MNSKFNFKKYLLLPVMGITIFLSTVSFQNDFFEIAKQIEIFTEMYKQINMNYVDDTNPAQLMDHAIEGMLSSLDPYTVFWTEQEVEKSKINQIGAYTGIGALIKTKKDKVTIIEPWKDHPADIAGLKAGDQIISVNGVVLKDYKDNLDELLKGSANSQLTLEYIRQGKRYTASLSRKPVEINAVPFYKMATDDIGYIVLSKFNQKASTETKQAITELKKQGAQKIILDLRGNPGGLLSEAVAVSNLFIDKDKLITSTQSVIKQYNKTYLTQRPAFDPDIPIAVLINGRSASASEIVSGSIQDYDRGVIIGSRSFGKGLVQRPKPLSYGTQVKITISRYYTPSGRCIQAINYNNRDQEGNALRTKEADYKSFKTINSGRTVFDGGGIQPDVEVASAAYSKVTTSLLNDNIIFDYATHYYYNNQVADLESFEFTNQDFNDFVNWLAQHNFDFNTNTETAFGSAFETAQQEELDDDIKTSYQALKEAIVKAKKKEIQNKKSEIISQLSDEIIKRYFYREGLYQYQLNNNPVILEAIDVLNDQNKYQKILK